MITVMRLRLDDAYGDLPFPDTVERRLGFDVPEYERLFEQDREQARTLIRWGREFERDDWGW